MSSWCALSTDSYGNYIEWAYCGYGNSNEDNCVFPFMYGGVEYSTCTDGWCATSAYENTKEYYSYKYCDADELALGLTTFDYGAGTTITGEDCVPMIYSGANYLNCNSDTGALYTITTQINNFFMNPRHVQLVCYKHRHEWQLCDLAILRLG